MRKVSLILFALVLLTASPLYVLASENELVLITKYYKTTTVVNAKN